MEIGDESKKWDFIEDPAALEYREKADNCASTIISWQPAAMQVMSEETVLFRALMEEQQKNFDEMRAIVDSQAQAPAAEKIFFESHPVMDGHRCAECFDTKVYTRCFYNPVNHRSFYFCRNCSESFVKKGFKLLESS